eukprot:CAMPEP_0113934876 /NCGR_PEP_ID=MMETSP1339-20121228/2131_1 /TAXON_ID=94617 /ORGANISM="Fibrocapsa japonica" /LENGTH=139 /DNA_ID=CAMNT_0000936831 /DNA_START=461 /DNA_END=880 /DNA_ORIENTATION=+ /assembly_acc=CAM_ASM_000762
MGALISSRAFAASPCTAGPLVGEAWMVYILEPALEEPGLDPMVGEGALCRTLREASSGRYAPGPGVEAGLSENLRFLGNLAATTLGLTELSVLDIVRAWSTSYLSGDGKSWRVLSGGALLIFFPMEYWGALLRFPLCTT